MTTYQRKTRDEWEIQGCYDGQHGWECVTTENKFREARVRLREYRDNEPGIPFRVKCVRVKIEGGAA